MNGNQSDNIATLINQAHDIFSQTSSFEVIDMEPELAADTLREFYDPISESAIEQYLNILELLRAEFAPLSI